MLWNHNIRKPEFHRQCACGAVDPQAFAILAEAQAGGYLCPACDAKQTAMIRAAFADGRAHNRPITTKKKTLGRPLYWGRSYWSGTRTIDPDNVYLVI